MSLTVVKGQFSSISPLSQAGATSPGKPPGSLGPACYPRHCPLLEELWPVRSESHHRSLTVPCTLAVAGFGALLLSPSLAVSRLSGGIHSPPRAMLITECGNSSSDPWSSQQWAIKAKLCVPFTKLSKLLFLRLSHLLATLTSLFLDSLRRKIFAFAYIETHSCMQ